MCEPRTRWRAGREVVGVILHERGAAGQVSGHDFHGAEQRAGFPVAFGAEAVAVGHQALDGESGQLLQAVQVFESGGEALEAAGFEKGAESEFNACAVAERRMARAAFAQRRGDAVELFVLGAELGDGRFVDGVDVLDEIADAIAVDGKAELGFGGDFVAFGHGDLAHVVAKACELAALPIVPGARRAHPDGDAVLHFGVGPMPDDDLAPEPQAGMDEPGFAVAMCGLVEVHEVHVDLGPGQVAIELGVEMQEGFAQRGEAADPHLRRAKKCASRG